MSRHLWTAGMALLLSLPAYSQSRRAYEGVVSWKNKTIGTTILLDIGAGGQVGGWIRLNKFTPIDGGTVREDSVEFQAAGNQYRIEERRGRITYSGPDGQGDRLLVRLDGATGRLEELIEATRFSGGETAVMEVEGRNRRFRFGRPALWKRQGMPFENFERVDELLGKVISVWVADLDERGGRIVAVEEPEGMDIPLKAPKKPKDKKEDDS